MNEHRIDCLGCRLANKIEDTQIVYEDELVTCFLDIAPLNEGHVLILPKQHYHDLDELDDLTISAVMKASQLIAKGLKSIFNPDGITVIQNNGAFNDLNHYHMHIFPRYQSDGFAWVEPIDLTLAKDRLSVTRDKLRSGIMGT
ncbi:HIT family protein [Paenibacillus baekrokdamisoli]|uniref:HIT family protein n=1 Tax=Paenibacillus baekrokdamisoli TaxID=1712516 RepID=A0A3G9JIM4_9BACL|nr:HIT family protein [Paenibacillus baekrokdamisoli]MBB3068132.1 diadenosine tetraphosphate (Ap4A) HIT family hydrolase [Paenibacillus baekrokdamisoli]BBH22824.1 HIT family protein [Paenibacillus baekrokdamisoli]